MPKEIKINEWEDWKPIVGSARRFDLDKKYGGYKSNIPAYVELDDGTRVDIRNPNLQIRGGDDEKK